MKIIAKPTEAQPKPTPKSLLIGTVYTWGVGGNYYMRTAYGAVCLNDGNTVPDDIQNRTHFTREVDVVEAALHVKG